MSHHDITFVSLQFIDYITLQKRYEIINKSFVYKLKAKQAENQIVGQNVMLGK